MNKEAFERLLKEGEKMRVSHFNVMAFIHDTFRCHSNPAIGSGSARALSSAEIARSPGSADRSRLVTRKCDQEWALQLR